MHWDPEVGCVYLETADALVLIDPLAPPQGTTDAADFWQLLESDIARTGHSLDILLSWAGEWMSHIRSAPEIRERHPDSRIWAPVGAKDEMVKRNVPVTNWFAPGDALPGGVQAFPTVVAGEVVFWLPEQRALVPADGIDGVPGGLCLQPDSWLAEGVTPQAQRDALKPLLELPIELVLVSHGEPVLVDGHAALAKVVEG